MDLEVKIDGSRPRQPEHGVVREICSAPAYWSKSSVDPSWYIVPAGPELQRKQPSAWFNKVTTGVLLVILSCGLEEKRALRGP